jgi:3-hydroxyisobutyrate dehydrogenase-like beta-hydroxyacid dehydrogenase
LPRSAQTLFYLGSAEQARVMKLALNLMVAGLVELLAEALVIGEANGLERTQLLDVISRSAVGPPLVAYKAAALIADDYSPTFSARLMHKDLGLVIDAAAQAGVPVPVATVEQLVQACVDSGMGDFSVLVPRLQHEAGREAA